MFSEMGLASGGSCAKLLSTYVILCCISQGVILTLQTWVSPLLNSVGIFDAATMFPDSQYVTLYCLL